jgi:hypothetical protein
LVIVVGASDGARGSLEPLPENARAERFVPFKLLMPLVDV